MLLMLFCHEKALVLVLYNQRYSHFLIPILWIKKRYSLKFLNFSFFHMIKFLTQTRQCERYQRTVLHIQWPNRNSCLKKKKNVMEFQVQQLKTKGFSSIKLNGITKITGNMCRITCNFLELLRISRNYLEIYKINDNYSKLLWITVLMFIGPWMINSESKFNSLFP